MKRYGFLLSFMFLFCAFLSAPDGIVEAPHVDPTDEPSSENRPTEGTDESWSEWFGRHLRTINTYIRPLAYPVSREEPITNQPSTELLINSGPGIEGQPADALPRGTVITSTTLTNVADDVDLPVQARSESSAVVQSSPVSSITSLPEIDQEMVVLMTALMPQVIIPEDTVIGSEGYELATAMTEAVAQLAECKITIKKMLAHPSEYTSLEVKLLIDRMQKLSDGQGSKKWTGDSAEVLHTIQRQFAQNMKNRVDQLVKELQKQTFSPPPSLSLGLALLPKGLSTFEVNQPTFVTTMRADDQAIQELLVVAKRMGENKETSLSQIQEKVIELNKLSNRITSRSWSSFSYGPDSEALNELQQEFATNVRNAVKEVVAELQARTYKPSLNPDRPSPWWNENLTFWDAVYRFVTRSKRPLTQAGKGQFTQAANYVKMAQQVARGFGDQMQKVLTEYNENPNSTAFSDAWVALRSMIKKVEKIHDQESALRALADCKGTLSASDVQQAFALSFEYSTDQVPVNPDQKVNLPELKTFLEVAFNVSATDGNPFAQGDLNAQLGVKSKYQTSPRMKGYSVKGDGSVPDTIRNKITKMLESVIDGKSTIASLLSDPAMLPTLIEFRNSWLAYADNVKQNIVLKNSQAISLEDPDLIKFALYNQRITRPPLSVDIAALCRNAQTRPLVLSVLRTNKSQQVPSDVAQQIVVAIKANDFENQYKKMQQQYRELTGLLSDPSKQEVYEKTRDFAGAVRMQQSALLAHLQQLSENLDKGVLTLDQADQEMEQAQALLTFVDQDQKALNALYSDDIASPEALKKALEAPTFDTKGNTGQAVDQMIAFEESQPAIKALDKDTVARARERLLDPDGLYQTSAAFRALPTEPVDQQEAVRKWLDTLSLEVIQGIAQVTDTAVLKTIEAFIKSWQASVVEQTKTSVELLATDPEALRDDQRALLGRVALSHNKPDIAAFLENSSSVGLAGIVLQGKSLPVGLLEVLMEGSQGEQIQALYAQVKMKVEALKKQNVLPQAA